MLSTKKRCFIGAVLFVSISLCLTIQALPLSLIARESLGVFVEKVRLLDLFAAMLFFLVTYILVDMSNKNPPKNMRIVDALRMYLLYKYIEIIGVLIIKKLVRHRNRIEDSQRLLFKQLLKRAGVTAYAQENKIDGMTTVEEFRVNHPLTDYSHYAPWIERVLRGEENVLFPEPVDYVLVTSGTTSGISKTFPTNKALFIKKLDIYLADYATSLKMPHGSDLKYILDFRFGSKVGTIGRGITKGPVSMMRVKQFKYVDHIPFIAKQITDFKAALYVNCLFALKERDIGILFFTFGSQAYSFFVCLERNWVRLCADIRRGRIDHSIEIEEENVLDDLNKALSPDPQRADELIAEFTKDFQDIVPRIWPSASVISSIFTGSFAVYRRIIQKLYAGSVPLRCNPHIASESIYGMNIWPDLDRVEELLFIHVLNFFEFIPFENIYDDQPPTRLLHELELGQQYEIVVTTDGGLYRYRTNDVITVVGYEGQIPTYTYAQRVNDTISVFAEKTPMCVLSPVVEETFARWPNLNLVEYAVTECMNINAITGQYGSLQMRYVLMVEILGDDPTSLQIAELDERLQAAADRYRHYRHTDQIQEMQVVRLRQGAFENLRQHLLASNKDASALQIKIPRRPTKEEHLRQLLDL